MLCVFDWLQTIAVAIAVGVFLHAGLHISCDFVRISNCTEDQFQRYLGLDFEHQPAYMDIVLSTEGISGIAMVFIMCIAFVLATRWFRRNLVKLPWPFHRLTGFNAFWYSHHLFVLVYILLIVHSFFLFLSHEWLQKTVSMNSVILYLNLLLALVCLLNIAYAFCLCLSYEISNLWIVNDCRHGFTWHFL